MSCELTPSTIQHILAFMLGFAAADLPAPQPRHIHGPFRRRGKLLTEVVFSEMGFQGGVAAAEGSICIQGYTRGHLLIDLPQVMGKQ